jgi:hypothetical protein
VVADGDDQLLAHEGAQPVRGRAADALDQLGKPVRPRGAQRLDRRGAEASLPW